MTIQETVEKYFEALHTGGWESYIADEFVFTNANLDNVFHGKEAYVQGAGRFFGTTTAVEIRKILISGSEVALLARYQVRSPKGTAGVCDVAEFLTVKGEKLTASTIIFDVKALAEFMAKN